MSGSQGSGHDRVTLVERDQRDALPKALLDHRSHSLEAQAVTSHENIGRLGEVHRNGAGLTCLQERRDLDPCWLVAQKRHNGECVEQCHSP